MKMRDVTLPLIVLRGAGDLASGVALRLYRAGLTRIVFLETPSPLAVRRTVSFSEAVYGGSSTVEGIHVELVTEPSQMQAVWDKGALPLMVDPEGSCLAQLQADVLVDAILAKKNIGTHKGMARFVIGLGPGFTAGQDATADVHAVVETMRGHYLGRVIRQGSAIPNTGAPAPVKGFSVERVHWAHEEGIFTTQCHIGEVIQEGAELGQVNGKPFHANFTGVIRGLLRDNTPVKYRTKLGDVDPRCDIDYCDEVSDKGLSIGGGVLEAIMHFMLQQGHKKS